MSAGDTTLTITGNLTGDPELRFTGTGTAVAAFTVAAARRVYDQASGQWKDGDTLFLRCSAWRELADHAAESLTKGMRVIVTGRLKQRTYETPGRRQAHRLRGRRGRRRPVAEVGDGEDRQDQPGQGAAPRRRRRPVAGPRTRRRGERGRRPAAVLTAPPRGPHAHLGVRPSLISGRARPRTVPGRPDRPLATRPRKVLMCVITMRSLSPTAPPSRRRSRPAGRARARARRRPLWAWRKTPTG